MNASASQRQLTYAVTIGSVIRWMKTTWRMHLAPTLSFRHTRDVSTTDEKVFGRWIPIAHVLPTSECGIHGLFDDADFNYSGRKKMSVQKAKSLYLCKLTYKLVHKSVRNSWCKIVNWKKENDAHTRVRNWVKKQKYCQGLVHCRAKHPVKNGATE